MYLNSYRFRTVHLTCQLFIFLFFI